MDRSTWAPLYVPFKRDFLMCYVCSCSWLPGELWCDFFLHVDSRISDPDEKRRGRKVKDIKVKEKLDLLPYSQGEEECSARVRFRLQIQLSLGCCVIASNSRECGRLASIARQSIKSLGPLWWAPIVKSTFCDVGKQRLITTQGDLWDVSSWPHATSVSIPPF